jgi:hypothetical protein
MIGGSAIAAVLFVGLLGWFAVPSLFGTTDYLGRRGWENHWNGRSISCSLPEQRSKLHTFCSRSLRANIG